MGAFSEPTQAGICCRIKLKPWGQSWECTVYWLYDAGTRWSGDGVTTGGQIYSVLQFRRDPFIVVGRYGSGSGLVNAVSQSRS